MSTKIYDAWIFSRSIESLIPALMRYRKVVRDAALVAMGREIRFSELAGVQFWRDAIEKATQSMRRGPLNLACSIMLYPTPIGTLIKPFGIDDLNVAGVPAIGKAIRGVKEYQYWNNTDRPNRITAKEWNQRRRMWNSVAGVTWAEGRGVTFDLVTAEWMKSSLWDMQRSALAAANRIAAGTAPIIWQPAKGGPQ